MKDLLNLLAAIALLVWGTHLMIAGRPHHLDSSAPGTPSLAISCAAREALHQADVIESMLAGLLDVIKHDDAELAQKLRHMDDTVDELYSAIKYYLTKISREALGEEESRRWTDIISFTINMEQIGDGIERVLHGRLLANLRLGMSVFLNGNMRDAQKLLEEKAQFRDLERTYAANHLVRLTDNTLHVDLISELKRINSHICSIAYPILESAGALAPNRLRQQSLDSNF